MIPSKYNGRSMSGAQFKENFPDTKLYKLICSGTVCKRGPNTDSNGIFFIESTHLAYWINAFDEEILYYRTVSIPDTATVHIGNNAMWADHVILSGKKTVKHVSDSVLISSFGRHPEYMNWLLFRKDLIKKIIKKNPERMKGILNCDKKIYKIAKKYQSN